MYVWCDFCSGVWGTQTVFPKFKTNMAGQLQFLELARVMGMRWKGGGCYFPLRTFPFFFISFFPLSLLFPIVFCVEFGPRDGVKWGESNDVYFEYAVSSCDPSARSVPSSSSDPTSAAVFLCTPRTTCSRDPKKDKEPISLPGFVIGDMIAYSVPTHDTGEN